MLDVDTLLESDGLFMTSMPDGRSYTWRLLTLKEYRIFRALRETRTLSAYQVHDKVFDRCYLGNPHMIDGDTPAGYTMSVGELIMWLSGDGAATGDKEDLEATRAAYPADTLHEHMKRTCLRAFPAYRIEDLEKWTRPMLLQRFVCAESMLVEGGTGYQPIELKNIMSADQKAKSQKRAQGIDFQRENAGLDQAMGGHAGKEDLWDLPPDQFQKKMKIAQRMEQRGRGA